MCGVVDGGIVSGLFGYEAGQSGVGDIFALVRREPGSGPVRRGCRRPRTLGARAPHRARLPGTGRGARPGRPRLALGKPVRPGRPRPVRCRRGPDPCHPRGARLPGTARGDRVRHPRDRRDVRSRGRAGDRAGRRRWAGAERPADADLRRRPATADLDRRAALRARRSGRRSTLPSRQGSTRTSALPRRPWARVGPVRVRAGRARRGGATTCSSPSTSSCTTGSGAVAARSCNGCARCAVPLSRSRRHERR